MRKMFFTLALGLVASVSFANNVEEQKDCLRENEEKPTVSYCCTQYYSLSENGLTVTGKGYVCKDATTLQNAQSSACSSAYTMAVSNANTLMRAAKTLTDPTKP